MADVDFSHAVLDVNPSGGTNPLTAGNYLDINTGSNLYDSSGNDISTGSKSIITNTPSKVSILCTGNFITSGTEFYIGYYSSRPWRVSNISFSNGDTYSFIIDIEVEGNT